MSRQEMDDVQYYFAPIIHANGGLYWIGFAQMAYHVKGGVNGNPVPVERKYFGSMTTFETIPPGLWKANEPNVETSNVCVEGVFRDGIKANDCEKGTPGLALCQIPAK